MYLHTHTYIFTLLLVLFMYLRVPSITVYTVCTQPADLMSSMFIYLHLLGKEGVRSQSNHVPIEGSWDQGNMVKLLRAVGKLYQRVKPQCVSHIEAVRLEL